MLAWHIIVYFTRVMYLLHCPSYYPTACVNMQQAAKHIVSLHTKLIAVACKLSTSHVYMYTLTLYIWLALFSYSNLTAIIKWPIWRLLVIAMDNKTDWLTDTTWPVRRQQRLTVKSDGLGHHDTGTQPAPHEVPLFRRGGPSPRRWDQPPVHQSPLAGPY